MGMNVRIRLYFKNYFKLYEETEMTTREIKEQLYSDHEIQKMIGVTENMVDKFWEALMDGIYDPEKKNLLPHKYILY